MIPLLDLPHCEARRLVQTGAPVFLTVNPVEYHGPHLSLHNDRLVSRGLLRDLHARLAAAHPDWPLLFASDLEVGVEPCCGPGTRHSRYAVTRELVLESCRALAELGAQRVILMTFHGAPLHNLALEAGVQLLRARGVRAVSPFHLVLSTLVRLDTLDRSRFAPAVAHIPDAAARAELLAALQLDFHAGFFETSVALHYAPDSVSPVYKALPPCPPLPAVPQRRLLTLAARLARGLNRDTLAGELAFAATGLGWFALRPFPGYTGHPHLAGAAAGAHFARFMLDEMTPAVEAVLTGRADPPPPIMRWLGPLSLGGRLGGVRLGPAQMPGVD